VCIRMSRGAHEGSLSPIFHPLHNLHSHANILISLVQLVTR
jgi:hypothetical protein